MKRFLFSIGSITAVVAPVVAVVACDGGDNGNWQTPTIDWNTKPVVNVTFENFVPSQMWNKVFTTNTEIKPGNSLELGLRGNKLVLKLLISFSNEAELKAMSASEDQKALSTRLGQLFFAAATDAQKQQRLTEVEISGTIDYLITGVRPLGEPQGDPSTSTHTSTVTPN